MCLEKFRPKTSHKKFGHFGRKSVTKTKHLQRLGWGHPMTMANRVPFYFFSFASPSGPPAPTPPLRMTDPMLHLHTNDQPDAMFASMVYNCPTGCIILQMVPNIIPASNVFFSLLTFWSEKKEVPFWSLKLVWRSVFGNNAKKVFARNGFTPKPKPKRFSGLFKRKKKTGYLNIF